MSTASLYTKQKEFEHLYSKNQLMPRIKNEFLECKEFDFVSYMEEKEIDPRVGLSLLVQMALHKRTTINVLVAILYPILKDAQAVSNQIEKCIEADLVAWNPMTRQLVVAFNISNDVQAEIDKYQYPLPMVIKPKPVIDNKTTGYLTTGGSLLLKKNHHDNDICLDHINRMNSIKFCINMDTVKMIKNKWRNLDKPKQGELRADFDKRKKAFEKYDRTSHIVIQQITEVSDTIHLTHKYDKRGRTYAQGYHVNYQGNAWNKAVIELADKELVE